MSTCACSCHPHTQWASDFASHAERVAAHPDCTCACCGPKQVEGTGPQWTKAGRWIDRSGNVRVSRPCCPGVFVLRGPVGQHRRRCERCRRHWVFVVHREGLSVTVREAGLR